MLTQWSYFVFNFFNNFMYFWFLAPFLGKQSRKKITNAVSYENFLITLYSCNFCELNVIAPKHNGFAQTTYTHTRIHPITVQFKDYVFVMK